MSSQAGKEKQGFVHEILSLKGMAQPEPSEDMKTRGKEAVKAVLIATAQLQLFWGPGV